MRLREIGKVTDKKLATEIGAFKLMHAQLVGELLGQFVAVHERQVVDTDADFAALDARI